MRASRANRWPQRSDDPRDVARRRMRDDVRNGLLGDGQKELPPTYFYDAPGSRLFDEITRLPEYYLTRAERELLELHAGEIMRRTRARSLVELGAGMSTKTRILLRALRDAGGRLYVPIDVDAATLSASAATLRDELPSVDVRPLVADLREQVAAPWSTDRPLLYAFLGSTIGNFDTRDARTLLARIRAGVCGEDSLLLGVDLVKDPGTLEAAYNDSRGVTAEFNRNVLRVLNRELGATFDLDGFEHRAFYNAEARRIEMHLVARHAQHALVPAVGVVRFYAGETIRTEISSKYDRESVDELLTGAGWRMDAWLTNESQQFALVLARPVTTGGALPTASTRRVAREIAARFRHFVATRAFAPRVPSTARRIGAEIEFLALMEGNGRVAPLEADDGRSVLDAVRSAARRLEWREGRSTKGAPWFLLPNGGRVSFEPGGQIEYATRPHDSATSLIDDLETTSSVLRNEAEARGIRLLDQGLDPINGPDDALLQVRGRRYRRMDAYFARIGPAGARMMRQTASLQIAIDIGPNAGDRWRLLNGLAPVLTAVFANSRRYAGDDTGYASYRAETWRRTDPSRTGLLDAIDPIGEYVDFALRAPAILLGADDEPVRPFDSWIESGAGREQWAEHLGTLFPEVRPRGYFEIRSIDAIPVRQWPAVLALVAGLAYDPISAREAAEIIGEPRPHLLERAGRRGLDDPELARLTRELIVVAERGSLRLGSRYLAERHLSEAVDFLRAMTI